MRSLDEASAVDHTGGARVLVRAPGRIAHRRTAARALAPVVTAARDSTDPQRRAQLWFTAVELHELAGHADPAAAAVDRAAMFEALCELAGVCAHDATGRAVRDRAIDLAGEDPDLLLRALTCLRAPLIWSDLGGGPRSTRVRDHLEAALARTYPAVPRARLLIATVFESGGGAAVALRYRRACEALDLAYSVGEPELICAALNAVAVTLTGPAMLTGWRAVAEELTRVAESLGAEHYRALAHYLHFRAACRDTDLPAAAHHADRALALARGGTLRTQLDTLVAFGAVVELLRGDTDAAERDYREFADRMVESGVAPDRSIAIIGDCALAWARGEFAGLRGRLAAVYATEPDRVAQPYVVALLRSGDRTEARRLFQRHADVSRHYFWSIMTGFRAHAAIALRDIEAAAELFDALLPYSGTILGFDTGLAVFGPADDLLADLATVLGDEESAGILRGRAETVRNRIHSTLDNAVAPN
ncbi:hypothetical protein [Nocardia arizonensis]|uniref:hypothetical protein n=1 Tax=Nocardia arizonensis TaxID=1141647 RepID=UPI0006D0FD3D|nr:hypothetical protein [Nocardia arizonensis]